MRIQTVFVCSLAVLLSAVDAQYNLAYGADPSMIDPFLIEHLKQKLCKKYEHKIALKSGKLLNRLHKAGLGIGDSFAYPQQQAPGYPGQIPNPVFFADQISQCGTIPPVQLPSQPPRMNLELAYGQPSEGAFVSYSRILPDDPTQQYPPTVPAGLPQGVEPPQYRRVTYPQQTYEQQQPHPFPHQHFQQESYQQMPQQFQQQFQQEYQQPSRAQPFPGQTTFDC